MGSSEKSTVAGEYISACHRNALRHSSRITSKHSNTSLQMTTHAICCAPSPIRARTRTEYTPATVIAFKSWTKGRLCKVDRQLIRQWNWGHNPTCSTTCQARCNFMRPSSKPCHAGAGQCRSSNATLSYRKPVEYYTLQYGDHGITSPDILCYVTRLPGLGPVCCTFNLTSLH